MCPFSMAMDWGGCFCRCSRVNPANSGKYLHCKASASVDNAGLNMAACANATSSAGLAVPLAALVLACVVGA